MHLPTRHVVSTAALDLLQILQPPTRASLQAVVAVFPDLLSGLPADVLVGKLKKDISFALRQGTIAQVTRMPLTATPAQRAVDYEFVVLNEAGWDR